MTADEFVARALAVPFKGRGRGWGGWDCYGLVRAFAREVQGIELPAFDVGYETAGDTLEDREAIQAMVESSRPAWHRVERPQAGDVLVLSITGLPIHMGVMVDHRRFLHAEKKLGTVVERLSSPIWAKRIEGAYRYAAS
ncbi:MAG TPA: NlpC/P60 family protein [Paracoccaceae bacterium]|nr:NlpC/P60 family protein [Paracoccaceae bacterium]